MTRIVALLVAGGAAACIGGDGGEIERANAELVGGTATSARPEVGLITVNGRALCTASLVTAARATTTGPGVILTAAHCFGFGTGEVDLDRFDVRFTPSSAGSASIPIVRVRSLGAQAGTSDLLLGQLDAPSTVAPARLAAARPLTGRSVVMFGYGCQDRSRPVLPGQKQSLTYRFGVETQALCPGDSGGPTFTTTRRRGRIFQVASAYFTATGNDIFGDVVAFSAALAEQIRAFRDGRGILSATGVAAADFSLGTAADGGVELTPVADPTVPTELTEPGVEVDDDPAAEPEE